MCKILLFLLGFAVSMSSCKAPYMGAINRTKTEPYVRFLDSTSIHPRSVELVDVSESINSISTIKVKKVKIDNSLYSAINIVSFSDSIDIYANVGYDRFAKLIANDGKRFHVYKCQWTTTEFGMKTGVTYRNNIQYFLETPGSHIYHPFSAEFLKTVVPANHPAQSYLYRYDHPSGAYRLLTYGSLGIGLAGGIFALASLNKNDQNVRTGFFVFLGGELTALLSSALRSKSRMRNEFKAFRSYNYN